VAVVELAENGSQRNVDRWRLEEALMARVFITGSTEGLGRAARYWHNLRQEQRLDACDCWRDPR
jgi:hypothetical protein